MNGNAKHKRMGFGRKKSMKEEIHFSTKRQKKEYQKKFRNGKNKNVANGNAYRKVKGYTKFKYVS